MSNKIGKRDVHFQPRWGYVLISVACIVGNAGPCRVEHLVYALKWGTQGARRHLGGVILRLHLLFCRYAAYP